MWRSLALVLAAFLVLVVVLTYGPQPAQTAETGAVAGARQVVDIELSEFAITPDQIRVPAGVPVVFNVTNAGSIDHDFSIDGVDGTAVIGSGATETLEAPAFTAGEYRVLCTIEGHEPAGMSATLVVAGGTAATGDLAAAERDMTGASEPAGDEGHPMTPEQMAQMHEQGVLDFPVESKGKGNQVLEPEIAEDGTKVFKLTADEVDWETKPGVVRKGMAYNGQIQGPRIEVDKGDTVRIELTNQLDEPTAMHSHGLIVPNEMDGVPGLTSRRSCQVKRSTTSQGAQLGVAHVPLARQLGRAGDERSARRVRRARA